MAQSATISFLTIPSTITAALSELPSPSWAIIFSLEASLKVAANDATIMTEEKPFLPFFYLKMKVDNFAIIL